MIESPLHSDVAPTALPRLLTVEALLWLLLGAAALLLRLADLARWPLAAGEAEQALAAWNRLAGLGNEALAGLSPLAYSLHTLLFATLGASDMTARLAQAVAGAALVLSPWLLRPLIGRGAALGTALLLALSPSVLFFSRNATGEVLGALCAMVLVAALLRWARWGAGRDGALAAVALGLGLAASGAFWLLLVALAVAAALGGGREGLASRARAFLRQEGWLALVAFLLAATTLATNLPGLGWALGLPLAWLRDLTAEPLALPFFFTVLLYELLLLAAAVIGTSDLRERHPGLMRLALIWAALLLVPAALLNSGWAAGVMWLALPLALLGGAALARLGAALWAHGSWRLEGSMALGGLLLLVFFRIISQMMISTPGQGMVRWLLMALLGTLLFVGLSALGALTLADRRDALGRGLALAALLLLAVTSVASAWGLSLARGADPREPLVVAPTGGALRTAATTLERVSTDRYRDGRALPVGIHESFGAGPRWYLRDFRVVEPVRTLSADLPEAALLPSDLVPTDRLGERVLMSTSWQRGALGASSDNMPQARWLLTRQGQGVEPSWATLYLALPQPEIP